MTIRATIRKDELDKNILALQIGEGEITFDTPMLITRIVMIASVWLFPEIIVVGLVTLVIIAMIVSYVVVAIVAFTFGIAEVVLEIRDALCRKKN